MFLLFIYIPQFPACCREYVGEIYELEYYYHPPILFISSFSFSFFILFLFCTLLYTNYHRWGLFVIVSKYVHMRSYFEVFIKRNPMCNCWQIKDVSLYDPQAYGPHTFFTTGFLRFLSIRRARGLQAFDLPLRSSYSNSNYD
jgi:hypothetical protein